jgi:hypothetical protein
MGAMVGPSVDQGSVAATPHVGKLLDLQMLVQLTGGERTTEQYAELLDRAGFRQPKPSSDLRHSRPLLGTSYPSALSAPCDFRRDLARSRASRAAGECSR